MKQILLFFCLIYFSDTCFSQAPGFAWVKTANGTADEQTNDIVISKDNFVYTCGVFTSSSVQLNNQTLNNAGGTDIFVAKYDTAGNIIWAKKYGGSGADNAVAIATDSLNNVYVTGSCTGTVNFGSLSFSGGNFILKINSTGAETWIVQPAVNVTVYDIAADPNGNTVICGSFTGAATIGNLPVTSTIADDGFVAKFNSTGGFIWMKQVYSTPPVAFSQYCYSIDVCRSVAIAPNGQIDICGSVHGAEKIVIRNTVSSDTMITTETFDSQQTYGYFGFVMKLDMNGIYLWGKDNMNVTNSGRYQTIANNIASNPAGDIYIAAEFLSKSSSQGFHYTKLIKYDGSGQNLWTNLTTGYLAPTPWIPVTTPKVAYYNGKAYFTEKIPLPNATYGADYAKTKVHCVNDSGTLIWTSLYTNTNSDIYSLAAKDDVFAGGILSNSIFGNLTATYSGGNDGYLAKVENYLPPVSPLGFSSANPDKTICPGGSIPLAQSITVSGGVQPYSYNWAPGTTLNNAFILNAVATPATSTNYILTVTDAAGSVLKDTVLVTVRPQLAKPIIQLIPGSATSWADTLVCNSPEPGLLYNWYESGSYVGNAAKMLVAKISWGKYTVNITNALAGCTATSDIFYYNAVKANAGNDTTVCSGQPVTLGGYPEYFGMAGVGGTVTYHWYSIAGNIATGVLLNPHITINPTTTADYILYIDEGTGNSEIFDTVTIAVATGNNTATITASGSTNFCQGDSVTLTSSPAASYLWSTGAVTQSIVVRTSGTYSVYTTYGTICGATSAPVNVTVNPLAGTATIVALGPTTFCAESSIMLHAGPGFSYLWNTGDTTQDITVSTSGSYSVQVTNSFGCSSAISAPVSITVNPLPSMPVITASGPTTFCQGNYVLLTSSLGISYVWSNGVTGLNHTYAYFSDTYTVKVSDINGCFSHASAPVTTTVVPLPATPQVIPNGPTTFCQGGNVTLLSSIAGNSYLWNNTISSQQWVFATGSATYSVSVIQNGCQSAASLPVTITVNPLPAQPTVSVSGPITFCDGQTVTISSSNGNSYLWSNGANTISINVNSSGLYSVQVADNNNCQSQPSDPVNIIVNPLPDVPVITQVGSILQSSSATGNQWYFNGTIIPGATEQNYTYTTGGIYSVEVTNSFGCSSTSQSITANRNIGVTLHSGLPFFYQVNANPVQPNSVLSFTLAATSITSVIIFDISGRPVYSIIREQSLDRGTHSYPVGIKLSDMQKGIYYVVYVINGERITQKIVVL